MVIEPMVELNMAMWAAQHPAFHFHHHNPMHGKSTYIASHLFVCFTGVLNLKYTGKQRLLL